ncbi:hypothetical protein Barb4_03118 [Bacteroidales bacterium Barb4]|nr:hypothetical protein Barb4_03118 [Bacteroidales bacterium Barb4]
MLCRSPERDGRFQPNVKRSGTLGLDKYKPIEF